MDKLSKESISLVGEFYVVAQLIQHGFVATPTLGKTKHVDILVYNRETENRSLVEVKTTRESVGRVRSTLFGENYEWILDKKHESIALSHLFYCFVLLRGSEHLPRFFIVPSKEVADYVQWEHQNWLSYKEKKAMKEMKKEGKNRILYRGNELTIDEFLERINTSMRMFRIDVNDPKKYENNWDAIKI